MLEFILDRVPGWAFAAGVVTTAVALVLILCTSSASAVGVGLVALEIVALAVIVGVNTTRRRVLGVPLAVVIGLCAATVFLSLLGLGIRTFGPADHYYFQGTLTTATITEQCRLDGPVRRRGGGPDDVCANSTWTVGGVRHTGDIVVSSAEDDDRTEEWHVAAYVMGDRGYSEGRIGTVIQAARFGAIPLGYGLWAAGVGALCVLVLWTTARKD